MEIQTALVTGASMGIGYEIARELAKKGIDLIIVSRSIEELELISKDFSQKYNVKVLPIAKDLMKPGAAEELYAEVTDANIVVNILVNNAGQGVFGSFTRTELKKELEIIELNIVSVVILTKLFLKDMIARDEGKILQVSSIVDKTYGPLMAVYAGTKSFVYNFTQSLINEFKESNVTISALVPGATDTGFFHKAGGEDRKIAQDRDSMANPADVAREGVEALMKGSASVVAGAKNKVMDKMSNVTPDQVLASQMHNMNKKEGE